MVLLTRGCVPCWRDQGLDRGQSLSPQPSTRPGGGGGAATDWGQGQGGRPAWLADGPLFDQGSVGHWWASLPRSGLVPRLALSTIGTYMCVGLGSSLWLRGENLRGLDEQMESSHGPIDRLPQTGHRKANLEEEKSKTLWCLSTERHPICRCMCVNPPFSSVYRMLLPAAATSTAMATCYSVWAQTAWSAQRRRVPSQTGGRDRDPVAGGFSE